MVYSQISERIINGEYAELILEYDGMKVTLGFEGVLDYSAECDTCDNWIDDVYCYSSIYDDSIITFDIVHFAISCRSVFVKEVYRDNI